MLGAHCRKSLLRAAHFVASAAIVFVCTWAPGSVQALPGEHNALPELCQGVGGLAYTTNEVAAFALPPPADFPPSVGAYAGNWALKLCPPQIVAPPDKTGPNGYMPNATTATSADAEIAEPLINDPNCYATIVQPLTKAAYDNFLGIPFFRGNWGDLGTPEVFHFNSSVDVRMLGNRPQDDPSTPGDESLADERGTTRNMQGQTVVKLPVGKNGLTYRADTLVSVMDFIFLYLPKVPAASKPFKEIVEKSGPLKAVVLKGYRALDLGVEVVRNPVGNFTLDQAIGLNWRHSQLNAIDDIYNQDTQDVWVYDVIPPSLTARTNLAALPQNVQAVLSYDAAREVFYLEAIHPGGVRNGTGVEFLGRLIDTHDHCNRLVQLANNGGGAPFWPTGAAVNLVWTATDPGPRDASGLGNSVQVTQRIEVRDSYPPVLLAPPSQVRELPAGQGNQTITLNLGTPRVFDLADLTPTVANDAAGSTFGLGLTEVTWSASDGVNTSEAVQLINIKAFGTNTAPVANAQTVNTQSFQDTEIVLSGSDADFHLNVNRFDPLTFSIVDDPDHGHFVAPLLPYFIDDVRLEASALKFAGDLKNSNPSQHCQTPGGPNPTAWQMGYPYQPEWIAVDDQGNSIVYDRGSARCLPGGVFTSGPRLVIFDASQNITAATDTSSGNVASDIFWDRNTNRIYVARIDSQADDSVVVYGPDLTQLARYNLGTGSGQPWYVERPIAVTVDERGVLYVANNSFVNAYFQVQGVPDVAGGTVFLGRAFGGVGGTDTIRSITTDSANNLYVGSDHRIFKVRAAQVSSNVFTAGAVEGWLGYCSSNLTAQYACDTPNRRSLGFACTNALCGRDTLSGNQPGQFLQAKGIAVDPHDVLYVADTGNARVQRFTTDGFFGGEAKSQGLGYGFLLGDFGSPYDIEVNSEHFYVLNEDADLLHIFETTPLTPIDDGHASVVYRSNNNFVGADQFRFAVTDGLASAQATVAINVTRNFRPPEVPDSGLAFVAPAVLEDQPRTFTVPGTDPDGSLDTLSVMLVTEPAHGQLTFNGLTATYTPDPNYAGPDAFTYEVFDGLARSEQLGSVALDVDPVEDTPTIEAATEQAVNRGFTLAHRVDVFDPDADETLLARIDWGDGLATEEGHFELNGLPIPAADAMNPEGTIRDDVDVTGPILGVDPRGRGILMADHVYTAAGTYLVSACVYDKVLRNDATQVKILTGSSKESCAATTVTVGSGAELAIEVDSPDTEQPPGANAEFPVRLRNLPFALDSSDPRFAQLPAAGAGIVGLALTGEVSPGLELLGIATADGVCSVSGAQLDCTVPSVPYDTDAELTVRVRVAPNAPGRTVLGVALEGEWLGMREAPSGGGTLVVATTGTAPSIAQVSPAEGVPEGFTEVTLTGTNFQAGAVVLFDQRPGSKVTVVNSTSLTVLSPAAPAGAVDVTVINPDDRDATLAAAWTYRTPSPGPAPNPNPIPNPNPNPNPNPAPAPSGGGGGGGGATGLEWLLLLCLLPASWKGQKKRPGGTGLRRRYAAHHASSRAP